MPDPLLTIGSFARAVGLSPSALRYYDECGLLRPAEVDETTSYRYYTPDLTTRAQLVAQMREAGMPIEAMRTVLDGAPTDAGRALREFIDARETQSARTSALLADVLAAVEASHGPAPCSRLTVYGPELAAALRQVRAAADSDAGSPLGSVLLDVARGSVDVVATNRYLMAVRTLPLDAPADDARVALSLPTAARLAELLDTCEHVCLEIGPGAARVAGQELAGRATSYPAHRLVLAALEPPALRAILYVDELVEAVRTVGRSDVTCCFSEAGVSVLAPGSEVAATVAAVVTGPGMTTRLGAALVQRVLGQVVGPQVELRLSAPTRPIRVASPHQRGFLALLMPLGEA
jgi:DNA-binding transcriptional MerR regulator